MSKKRSLPLPNRLEIDRPLVLYGVLCWAVLLVALLRWLDFHGYFISPDAIYMDVLAKSFGSHPYWIWFKRAYSYPYEIIHPDFVMPPLWPLVHWFLGAIGITTWHRGNWMTAVFTAGLVPTWMWAITPHFEKKPNAKTKWRLNIVLAGIVATLLLLAQARNQMWEELYLGIVSPIAVFFFVLSYGAYVRERYVACGVLTGIAFLIRFDAQITMVTFVLGHLLAWAGRRPWKRILKECFWIGFSFVAVTAPWWLRSVYYGHSPWFNHMVPIFLYGEAGNFRWFPDTDTGVGHPLTNEPYILYESLVRNRWTDLISPYLGDFLTPLAMPGILLFLGFLYALRRPKQRPLLAFVWVGALLRLTTVAGLADSFNRRYFLIFDACAITWITLMLWDSNRLIRHTAKALAILLILANWNNLTSVLRSLRPYVGYLDAGMSQLSQTVAELDSTHEPVLAAQIEGHAIAYYTDGIPIIELPTNDKDAGMMDQYLDRWKIRWTTLGEKLKPYVKKHSFIPFRSRNGITIWKVEPSSDLPIARK